MAISMKCALFSFTVMMLCNRVLSVKTIYLDEQNGNTFYADPAIRMKVSRYSTQNRNLNSSVILMAKPNEQVVTYIRSFDTSCSTKLIIYDGPDKSSLLTGPNGLCGLNAWLSKSSYNSSRNALLFVFATGSSQTSNSFEFITTSYHYGTCKSREFRCSNSRCIDGSLECNGYNNCADRSDELLCDAVVLGAGIIAAIVIGSCLFLVCLPVIIVGLICRRRRRYHYGGLN